MCMSDCALIIPRTDCFKALAICYLLFPRSPRILEFVEVVKWNLFLYIGELSECYLISFCQASIVSNPCFGPLYFVATFCTHHSLMALVLKSPFISMSEKELSKSTSAPGVKRQEKCKACIFHFQSTFWPLLTQSFQTLSNCLSYLIIDFPHIFSHFQTQENVGFKRHDPSLGETTESAKTWLKSWLCCF